LREEFVVKLAEEKKLMSVVNASVAAINHFCSRNRFDSPLKSPYFVFCAGLEGDQEQYSQVPHSEDSFLSGPHRPVLGIGSHYG
jgi:hypothetical protein